MMNINRVYQGNIIRVQFPLHIAVRQIKGYLRHYVCPTDQAYEASLCNFTVNGREQDDTVTVAKLKYKKLYAYIECPVHISSNS